ncbi:MAG: hypothetical protein HQL27_10180 [Candidatus Omnitrophica bacterium]|nr:hypothetical protein [Candidatus Omnitrophota bacterium]
MNNDFETAIESIIGTDDRYKPDAYLFVMESLAFTQGKIKEKRHVTGQELLSGMRELLLDKYGPLTVSVLRYWGIKSTEDFGNIVFNLVNNRVLSKTEEDTIDHFRNVFDFDKVFNQGYREILHKKISRM